MQHWFLSYHSPDQALAERLKAAIERKDAASRVFFAPTHLRAGGSWSAQLAQELAEANGFILLIGEFGIGKWQLPEYYEAHDRWVNAPTEFPLVVVLLEGQTAPGLPFLRQLHWIITPDPASEKDVARLFDAASGGSRPGDLWRYTSPYRGLAAMEEKDSDYFFGRKRETSDVLSALAGALDRLPVLIGNSGVGKSSLAQAGVLAALKRQAWPADADAPNGWPHVFANSRRWCFLTLRPGTEPVRTLVEAFLDTWQLDRTSTEWPSRRTEWVDALLGRKLTLRDLLDQTERRYVELHRSEPPTFFLYIDQGEELYVRALDRERRCFSEILAGGLGEPRLRTMMSMRADFFGELQKDQPLDDVSQKIEVKPLREAQLLEVVKRPAELLSARFENDHLAGEISRRTAEESAKDAGALPLLSYLLEDMWQNMVERGDGKLRLPAQSIDLGLVLVQRADAFLARYPNSEESLRRIFTLKFATVREDGEPTRRRALRSEFTEDEWKLVSDLADHPNRLLVTATPESGVTYAEVAHEAIFRRWDKLKEWIAAEREFLAWRSSLEAARRTWQATPDKSKYDALLMGAALTQAHNWFAQRAEDLPKADREFIALSIERLRKEERRQQFRLGLAAGAATATVAVVAGLSVWALQSRNSAVDALTSSLFATDRLIQSATSSLAEGETLTNLLRTSCDLLDSLQDRVPRDPRTNAIVVCAVERSASRDRLNEPAEASRILAGALAIAEEQYSRTRSPDDALAVLEARHATLARILASSQTAGGAHELNEFVERARSLSNELPFEVLPKAAAERLQTLAVLLAKRNSLQDAVVAADAAIELRQLAITRGAGLGVVFDNVTTILLNAELHRRKMDEVQATQAVERARALFGEIDPAAPQWQDRYRKVQEMIDAAGKGAQR